MKRNNKKGFTIVELVIVIAVIAILSAVLIPTFGGIISDANETAAQQTARNEYTEYIIDNPTADVDYILVNGTTDADDLWFSVDDGFEKVNAPTGAYKYLEVTGSESEYKTATGN